MRICPDGAWLVGMAVVRSRTSTPRRTCELLSITRRVRAQTRRRRLRCSQRQRRGARRPLRRLPPPCLVLARSHAARTVRECARFKIVWKVARSSCGVGARAAFTPGYVDKPTARRCGLPFCNPFTSPSDSIALDNLRLVHLSVKNIDWPATGDVFGEARHTLTSAGGRAECRCHPFAWTAADLGCTHGNVAHRGHL